MGIETRAFSSIFLNYLPQKFAIYIRKEREILLESGEAVSKVMRRLFKENL